MTHAFGLTWSIKSTFVDYISAMSDGQITVSDGAVRESDGTFFFPALDQESSADELQFAGSVAFTGHFGMLALTFAAPAIVRLDDALQLTIDDRYREGGRRTVASLGPTESDGGVTTFPSPILTLDGAEMFFGNYPPGTVLDVVVVTSPRDVSAD